MKASMKKKRGVVGATVLAGILAVGGYALTNTITFSDDAANAGFGAQVVHKADVTDVDFVLDTTDKSVVREIQFILDGAITSGGADGYAWVRYNKVDGTTAWADCGTWTDGATQVDCDVTALNVPVQDIGETDTGQTAWADNDTEPGDAGRGGDAPLELVISE